MVGCAEWYLVTRAFLINPFQLMSDIQLKVLGRHNWLFTIL